MPPPGPAARPAHLVGRDTCRPKIRHTCRGKRASPSCVLDWLSRISVLASPSLSGDSGTVSRRYKHHEHPRSDTSRAASLRDRNPGRRVGGPSAIEIRNNTLFFTRCFHQIAGHQTLTWQTPPRGVSDPPLTCGNTGRGRCTACRGTAGRCQARVIRAYKGNRVFRPQIDAG